MYCVMEYINLFAKIYPYMYVCTYVHTYFVYIYISHVSCYY